MHSRNQLQKFRRKIKGYKCFNKNRKNPNYACGGVATFIKDHLPTQELNIQSDIEVVATKILAPISICICNIYIPNSYSFEIQEINDIIKQITNPFILLGDFNSHHTLWGSYKIDTRGLRIESSIEESNMVLLNSGQSTHINISNGKLSAIDLTFSSITLAQKCNWSVSDYPYDSDHYPIFISICSLSRNIPTPPQHSKWNFNKADWNKFQKLIDNELSQKTFLTDSENINSIIQKFSDCIIKSANESILRYEINHKGRQLPWWNNQCKESIKIAKHAFNRFKKHNTLENRIEYKRTRAAARRIINDSKAKSWDNFVSSISNQSNISECWKKIKTIKGNKRSNCVHFLQYEDQIITKNEEIANKLAETFAKNSSSQNYSKEFIPYKNEQEKLTLSVDIDNSVPLNHINNIISMNELTAAIDSSKNSSPGPDKIPNILIKNLPRRGMETLLKIYNKIWENDVFPKIWKKAIVVPVPKPGRDQSNSDNYRPISLTCNMCKIMEKIINNRLRWILDHHNIIKDNQFGFRRGHSTQSHLISTDTYIQEAFVNNQDVMLVNLDIEKAYDMVWTYRIKSILRDIGIKDHMYNFLINFMSEREIQVRVNTHLSTTKTLDNGLPQGSILSVTLFLLAINDAGKDIKAPVIIRKFADDIIVLCRGKHINSVQTSVQEALDVLHGWSLISGFKFSVKKTECVLFSKRKQIVSPQLFLGKQALQFVQSTRILGLLFDNKMTWNNHINKLADECKNRLNILKCLSHNNWGADRNLLLLTYKAIIRSKIDYGAIIYNSAKSCIKKLDIIHNQALRICTGCFRTTPIGSI